MDGGAWKPVVHGVTEGRTRLSDFTFTFHFHALEKEMATHSSVLAWRIPGKEISPEYSLEEQMLKLKLQYFGHLMRKTDSLKKSLMLGIINMGGEGDNRG